MVQSKNPTLIHNLDNPPGSLSFSRNRFIFLLIAIIVIGSLSGFMLSALSKSGGKTTGSKSGSANSQQTAGIADKKTFKDKAEGVLKEGGVDGEGNFHLQRPGGESQNVYLTSTTVDLSGYIGKKVRVWGETFQAEKAGWLMDVGLVEVLQ